MVMDGVNGVLGKWRTFETLRICHQRPLMGAKTTEGVPPPVESSSFVMVKRVSGGVLRLNFFCSGLALSWWFSGASTRLR